MANAFPRNIVNLSKEDFLLIRKAIKHKKVIEGPDIREFENLFSAYIGAKQAIAVSSARAGLVLILKAFDFRPGDEVILPAYTFHVMPAVIKSMGLRPVFVDVKINTYNIDVSLIEEKITSRTRAILATHLLGQPCEMDKIIDLSQKYNIKVIEDCAHSCGAEYEQRKVGSIGDAAIFSFGMGKLMTCFGGGIITCSDERLKNKLLHLLKDNSDLSRKALTKRVFKYSLSYLLTHIRIFPYFGYFAMRFADLFNSDIFDRFPCETIELYEQFPKSFYTNFTNLQAMIGISQLNFLDKKIERIIKNAEIYNRELSGFNNVITPFVESKAKHVYLYYPIRVENRKHFRKELFKSRVDTKIDYIAVCPELEIFSESNINYPAAKEISRTSLELPCYYSLSEENIYQIAENLKRILSKL